MRRWPIERSWEITSGKGVRQKARSSKLAEYRACGMLGAAGLGKTWEMSRLATLDRQGGLDVRIERLAVLGQTPGGLKSQLEVLASGAGEKTVLYLDALDEVMVPVKTAGLIIQRWVLHRLAAQPSGHQAFRRPSRRSTEKNDAYSLYWRRYLSMM
jgi:hypothetical protein